MATASLDAKLVALGVLQDDPIFTGCRVRRWRHVPGFLLARSESQESVDFPVHLGFSGLDRNGRSATRVQVQMEAVLPQLRRVHLLKVNPRPLAIRIDNRARRIPFLLGHIPRLQRRLPGRESVRRVLHLVVQRLRPEPGETIRVGTIEYNLRFRCHASTGVSETRTTSLRYRWGIDENSRSTCGESRRQASGPRQPRRAREAPK